MTNTDSPGRAGRREWIGLAVLALPCLLYSMDLTVLHLAVPKLTRRSAPEQRRSCSGSSTSTASWSPASLITMGTLGDRIGRRRLLLIGAAAFGAASIARRVLDERPMLIADARAARRRRRHLAPSTLSLIRNMFLDPRQRTTAIGVWITSFSVGGAIGPLRRRHRAGVLLVGLRLPARRAGDGAAADPRTAPLAGVPGSRGRPPRPAQRLAVAAWRCSR